MSVTRRAAFATLILAAPAAASVDVVPVKGETRIEVRVDGKPFTQYLYGPEHKKPILFPLQTDRGTTVTRGYPIAPRPGERVDHPHHTGLWLSYGNVNGVDFWNNSDQNPRTAEMGTIVHTAVREAKGGGKQGELAVAMEWRLPGDKPVLSEETRFTFAKGKALRSIDRVTTLTALDTPVAFEDNKEGLIGLRVARFLEHRSEKPVERLDAAAEKPAPAAPDDSTITGRYSSSQGESGVSVWGTRARWVALNGKEGDEAVAIVILDHPKNPGFPTYWHARDYGLFAANPLGAKLFSEGKDERMLKLAARESATFRYRILIFSKTVGDDGVEKEYSRFLREVR